MAMANMARVDVGLDETLPNLRTLIIPAIKLAVSADDAPRLFQQRNSDEL